MWLMCNLEGERDKVTNFHLAHAVLDLCDGSPELDAEVLAKMILLQVDARKGGGEDGNV